MADSCSAFALDKDRPVLPLLGNLGQNIAHDTSRCHEAMAFTFKDTDLTAAHRLTKPLDILRWNARVFAAMVDHHRSRDIHVAESNCLATLEAGQQINCRVGVGGGQLPDLVGETSIIVTLSFDFVLWRLCARPESRVTFSVRRGV
jgi:hypothetical protein